MLLLPLALAGCSATHAVSDRAASAADPKVKDPGPRVAICYNSLKTSAEKAQELAQAECLGDTVAERADTDYRLDNCPVLTPGRATFVCKPKPKPK